MHPALSVIAFTTLSGAGYGLAFVLGTGHGNPAHLSTKLAWVLALVLIGLGLVSSTLHLGNPQRAWRAFSQWRSSWLSREGVLAIVTFVPLTILAAMSIFADTFSLTLGYVGAFLSLATVFCTAMIYASLRTIPTWHTWLTPAVYLAFSVTAGTVLYMTFFGREGGSASNQTWAWLSIVFLLIAWGVKTLWVTRAAKTGYGASTMETATGLGHLGKVRLLERPHAMGNYLTNEMAFRIARKHERKLWAICVVIGLAVPLVLLALSLVMPGLATLLQVVATLSLLAGIFLERWLFFATAKHVVGLYYGGEEALRPAD